MFNKIQNLTDRQVILRLNSGKSLYIDPGSTSGQVLEIELKGNPMVRKLRDRRVIALYPVEAQKEDAPVSETAAPAPKTIEKPKEKTKSKSKGGK
jgi:hypothetical protein